MNSLGEVLNVSGNIIQLGNAASAQVTSTASAVQQQVSQTSSTTPSQNNVGSVVMVTSVMF